MSRDEERQRLLDFTGTAGPAYVAEHDRARLSGQLLRIRELMADRRWRTLGEIASATGDPQASISAQLRHLRKQRFGSHIVEKRRRGEESHGLYEYRVLGGRVLS